MRKTRNRAIDPEERLSHTVYNILLGCPSGDRRISESALHEQTRFQKFLSIYFCCTIRNIMEARIVSG